MLTFSNSLLRLVKYLIIIILISSLELKYILRNFGHLEGHILILTKLASKIINNNNNKIIKIYIYNII